MKSCLQCDIPIFGHRKKWCSRHRSREQRDLLKVDIKVKISPQNLDYRGRIPWELTERAELFSILTYIVGAERAKQWLYAGAEHGYIRKIANEKNYYREQWQKYYIPG